MTTRSYPKGRLAIGACEDLEVTHITVDPDGPPVHTITGPPSRVYGGVDWILRKLSADDSPEMIEHWRIVLCPEEANE